MAGPIVVVGSMNLDLMASAPHIPVPGETILGTSLDTFSGGKGGNQALAAAKLGAEVVMIGAIGADTFGEKLRSDLSTAESTSRVSRPLMDPPARRANLPGCGRRELDYRNSWSERSAVPRAHREASQPTRLRGYDSAAAGDSA